MAKSVASIGGNARFSFNLVDGNRLPLGAAPPGELALRLPINRPVVDWRNRHQSPPGKGS
jgi:hypothetical protein